MFEYFGRSPRERHATDSQLISQVLGGGDSPKLPSPLDFERLAQDGYRVNPMIYGCMRIISQSVAEPTLKALTVDAEEKVKTDTVVGNDPLARLIMQPNPDQDAFEFFEQLLIHLTFSGNAFIHKVRSGSGQVVGLELIRPDIMGIVPGTTRAEGKVKNYTVKVNETPIPLRRDDVIHFRLPDALDEFWGLSPIFVLARYGDVDVQSAEFLRAYFLNKGIPAGILTFEHPVQKPERERVRDMWKDQFNALQGWHNLAVLDAKVNYQNIQTGIKDVDMDGITNQTETRICAVYGVPPILISALSGIAHATFANVEESRKLFWMQTATPLFTRLGKKLTNELAIKEFGETRRIVFDLSSVPALQENKSEIRKVAMQGWNSGLYTRDQTFKLLGHTQETVQGDLIKVLPGTEFRPVEDQATKTEPTKDPPKSGGAISRTDQGTKPTETFDLTPLEGEFGAAFDKAVGRFPNGMPTWADDDPEVLAFDEALQDDDISTLLHLLRLDAGNFGLVLSPVLKSYALKLQDGQEATFSLDVTTGIHKSFMRLEAASVESARLVFNSDRVVDKRGLLFKSVGLLPSQAFTLIKAEEQFIRQGRTDDERETALGRLRTMFLDKHRAAFAKEASALVVRELQEQIELNAIMGEEDG